MSISIVLRICAALYLAAIIFDLVRTRRLARFLWQIAVLLILIAIDALLTNAFTGRVSFGEGTSSNWVVLVMFVCVLLGIGARYIFYLKESFSWLEFIKPLCISPIVLLPLLGSIQAVKTLETMQVISFALLAFQNGFFWQIVLERAKPKTQSE